MSEIVHQDTKSRCRESFAHEPQEKGVWSIGSKCEQWYSSGVSTWTHLFRDSSSAPRHGIPFTEIRLYLQFHRCTIPSENSGTSGARCTSKPPRRHLGGVQDVCSPLLEPHPIHHKKCRRQAMSGSIGKVLREYEVEDCKTQLELVALARLCKGRKSGRRYSGKLRKRPFAGFATLTIET